MPEKKDCWAQKILRYVVGRFSNEIELKSIVCCHNLYVDVAVERLHTQCIVQLHKVIDHLKQNFRNIINQNLKRYTVMGRWRSKL